MRRTVDLERYLSFIHSSPPDVLGRLLADILGDPDEQLEHLKVFVPEASLMLSRLLFAQDLDGASRLTEALDAVMKRHDLSTESPGYVGASLEARDGHTFAYYIGRLQALLVLARRLPVLEIPDHIRAEVQDGGANQAIIQILAEGGPMSSRTLRQTLRDQLPDEGGKLQEDLHRRLTWLVRAGVVETRTKRGLLYSLSPLGSRLLDERPPWVEAVELSYRAYRLGIRGLPCPFGQVLDGVYRRIDLELGEVPAPTGTNAD